MQVAQGWANLQELRRGEADMVRSATRPAPQTVTVYALYEEHMSFLLENSAGITPIRTSWRRPDFR